MDSSQHLDLEALASLKDIMEDDFGLLIDTFINDSEQRIASLAQELERSDSDGVRRSAHSFKGSSSNIGAPQLTELCQLLEDRGNDGKLEGMKAQLDLIREEFDHVRTGLRAL
jgi:HPt (histidine-containing phosphotransfer) domain-containing protein